tara:strand:+ start:21 stop:194 length:174 start_codon:yes stop_codon:yes gene_type:complete
MKSITNYYIALGTIVKQVGKNPQLDEFKGKGFIKIQKIKDLGEKDIIELANNLLKTI